MERRREPPVVTTLLEPLRGSDSWGTGGPVVSLRSTTGYRMPSLRDGECRGSAASLPFLALGTSALGTSFPRRTVQAGCHFATFFAKATKVRKATKAGKAGAPSTAAGPGGGGRRRRRYHGSPKARHESPPRWLRRWRSARWNRRSRGLRGRRRRLACLLDGFELPGFLDHSPDEFDFFTERKGALLLPPAGHAALEMGGGIGFHGNQPSAGWVRTQASMWRVRAAASGTTILVSELRRPSRRSLGDLSAAFAPPRFVGGDGIGKSRRGRGEDRPWRGPGWNPSGVPNHGERGTGGVAPLNHRLQAGIPPGWLEGVGSGAALSAFLGTWNFSPWNFPPGHRRLHARGNRGMDLSCSPGCFS